MDQRETRASPTWRTAGPRGGMETHCRGRGEQGEEWGSVSSGHAYPDGNLGRYGVRGEESLPSGSLSVPACEPSCSPHRCTS